MKKYLLIGLPLVLVACHQTDTVKTSILVPQASTTKIQQQSLLEPIPTIIPTVVGRTTHAAHAFTEGLEYYNGYLYESTGLDDQSTLRKVDINTGTVIQQRIPAIATTFAEGITILNKTIYQLTYTNAKVMTYNSDTLQSINQMSYSGEGWGLANDGSQLIMSNGSANLVWRNPTNFAITRQQTVRAGLQTVTKLNELEYVKGQIYANIFLTNRIARIDPKTGYVLAWIDISSLAKEAKTLAAQNGYIFNSNDVANGIAYKADTDTFFVTGKDWPIMFEVKIK